MSINLLETHRKIGIDFDGTLIDHPKSAMLHEYISSNRFDQEFYIVTFRSHGMEKNIWRDLSREACPPRPSAFSGVVNISNHLFETGYMNQRAVAASIVLPSAEYTEWKGKECFDRGITVLIDDMPAFVMPGCSKYGIAYINPDAL